MKKPNDPPKKSRPRVAPKPQKTSLGQKLVAMLKEVLRYERRRKKKRILQCRHGS